MGKNKLKKFRDMETIDFVFQYPFAVLNEKGFPLRGKWHKEFFGNDNPIVLELGCGKGEYTVGLARRYPDKNFIGVDIKGSRMWTGATQARSENLGNVAFLRTNIELIDRFFNEGEVSEIWITFPDPHMKKERKRLNST
ncbi:MAG: tRNA (guanosine(46)-N7)-methyltransferase TrmB, partial [Muribaculaceae bacterium]|nr:tRNA (guanosine(46)-N7)-methyltransferase TrmB [Muribaculaceae bacterium]